MEAGSPCFRTRFELSLELFIFTPHYPRKMAGRETCICLEQYINIHVKNKARKDLWQLLEMPQTPYLDLASSTAS